MSQALLHYAILQTHVRSMLNRDLVHVFSLCSGLSHIVAVNKSKRCKVWLHFIRLDANSIQCNMQKGSAAKNSKTAHLMRRFNVNRINIRAESCSVSLQKGTTVNFFSILRPV